MTKGLFPDDVMPAASSLPSYTYTKFAQGRESNISGQFVESCIIQLAEQRGYKICNNQRSMSIQGDLLMQDERLLMKNVGYKDLIGKKAYTEFLILAYGRKIRIDCKGQNIAGSTYQKVGWMYLDAVNAMPEKEIIYVVHGSDKTWRRAYRWLREECRHLRKKIILVLTLEEYQIWFKHFDEGKK